jgi:uncharacterized protein
LRPVFSIRATCPTRRRFHSLTMLRPEWIMQQMKANPCPFHTFAPPLNTATLRRRFCAARELAGGAKLDGPANRWYGSPMQRQDVLDRLREHESALRARGVKRAALFGSIARGEGHAGSDIDIMVEIDPSANIGLFEYVGITQFLEDLFPTRVDVANRSCLKSLVRPNAERDAVYAF